jgi:hypothetical protein
MKELDKTILRISAIILDKYTAACSWDLWLKDLKLWSIFGLQK